MEDSVKQRLMRFIESQGISQGKFERMSGLSNGYLCNLKRNIGSSKILSISQAFPQLNTEWLLTGEGEMLNADYTTFNPVGAATPMGATAPKADAPNLEKEIVILKAQLEEKEKMIALLQKQLAELNELHRALMSAFTNVVASGATNKKVAEG